jgi:hypothetical protein
VSKGPPVITPWYYDTKEGIDYFTQILHDHSDHKWTPEEHEANKKLNQEMKLGAYEDHAKALKKFDGMDKSTYPSEPRNRGKLLEMKKLEEDLNPKLFENIIDNLGKDTKKVQPKKLKTGNPSGRDYWKEFVASDGKKMPKVSPEDRNQLTAQQTWNAIYQGMSPQEKGTWNAEQRRKKQEKINEYKKENPNLAQQIIKDTMETHSKGLERMNVKREEVRKTPRFPEDQMEFPFAYNKPQSKYGLHEDFVNNKLYEGEIVKKVEKEIDDEKI